MTKKVLFLVGSPRRRGNTMQAVAKAMEEIESYGMTGEMVFLHDYEIKPCRGCNGCQQGECTVKDDMNKLEEMMLKADTLVIATPVYMVGVPGIVKVFMDRTTPLRYRQGLKGKNAAIITIAECTGHEVAQMSVANFIYLHGMKLLNTATCYPNGKPASVLEHKGSVKAIERLSKSVAESKRKLTKVGLLQLNPGIQCFLLPFANGNLESCWRVLKTFIWPKFFLKNKKISHQTY